MRTLFCCTAFLIAASAALGQTEAKAPPRFELVDVHPSGPNSNPFVRGPYLSGQRYDVHNASLVDLIVRAYGTTADKVLDGPSWLEYERFDVSAKPPANTSTGDAALMLRSVLSERFHVVIRNEDRPLPSYVLTAPKGKPKLKVADGAGSPGCKISIDQPRPAESRPAEGPVGLPASPTVSYTCVNITMASFAEQIRTMLLAQQYVGTNPVRDKTGIEGKWDFNFKYTLPMILGGESITLPVALEQLGLKLEQETAAVPVIVVEKAERPTPNEPDVAEKIPASPTEFEVATVRPFVQGAGPNMIGFRMMPGGRFEMSGVTVKMMVQQAWGVPVESIIDAPKWMETDRYNIVAKIPGAQSTGQNAAVDLDSVYVMLRALLAERFQLAAHLEDRTMTAFNLTAPKPRLKKADPATRTKWSDVNAGLPVMTNGTSPPSRNLKFQNMTMAQFARQLQYVAGAYIHSPVSDETGLEGSFDFTLTFSQIAPEQFAKIIASNPQMAGNTTDPVGGVTIFEAVDKQLGLKLAEQKRPVSVLVIDRAQQQPTEN